MLDVALCLAALPLIAPLMILVAVVVRVDSGGPVLYRGKRIGLDQVPFEQLKFRTMAANAPGLDVTASDDPRITRVGRFLRASKLDELPQLINVLRGEMSLVGPRPEVPRYVALYSSVQRRVLSVRPGMACAAFLYFGHEQDFIERADPPDVEQFYLTVLLPRKLDVELRYVEDWSLGSDLRILARTFAGLLLSIRGRR
jgi:lipopolysaccharide/colanic/teichoic acid biosynthesis glycosyltransferase